LDRLRQTGAFSSPLPGGEHDLVYPIEQWLSWRYHAFRASGVSEPEFPDGVDKAAVMEAIDTVVNELETGAGLEAACRWYIERVRARLREYEARGATARPLESVQHAEVLHAAFLAEKRDQLARLEAAPMFPGSRAAVSSTAARRASASS
jgi:hypothetical protein